MWLGFRNVAKSQCGLDFAAWLEANVARKGMEPMWPELCNSTVPVLRRYRP